MSPFQVITRTHGSVCEVSKYFPSTSAEMHSRKGRGPCRIEAHPSTFPTSPERLHHPPNEREQPNPGRAPNHPDSPYVRSPTVHSLLIHCTRSHGNPTQGAPSKGTRWGGGAAKAQERSQVQFFPNSVPERIPAIPPKTLRAQPRILARKGGDKSGAAAPGPLPDNPPTNPQTIFEKTPKIQNYPKVCGGKLAANLR